MIKVPNHKLLIIQLVIIILLSSLLTPVVNGKKTDLNISGTDGDKKSFQDSLKTIDLTVSSEKADLLLKRFYDIEKNTLVIEKIKKQIGVLTEFDIITIDDIPKYIFETLNKTDTSFMKFPDNKNVFIGPTIISHFVPYGRIYGANFNKSWYYNHSVRGLDGFTKNVSISRVVGAFPFFLGISFRPVYVTVFSRSYLGGYSKVYFPFLEILSPCIGMSIRIIGEDKHGNPVIYFEYNLDLSFFCILKGISF